MGNIILIMAIVVGIISLYSKRNRGVSTTTIRYAISLD
jgi:hypothetical protein